MSKLDTAELKAQLQAAKQAGDPQSILALIPYAQFIGMDAGINNGKTWYRLRQQESNIGNPTLPAIHGGVIGGFMELSAMVEVLLLTDTQKIPKVVDFSIDYLRPGRFRDTGARCTLVRQGRRVANVAVTAWQESPDNVIATARCHFLIAET